MQGPNLGSAFQSPSSLCRDAADTLCALALALGPDLALFVPALRKVRTGLSHVMHHVQVLANDGLICPADSAACC